MQLHEALAQHLIVDENEQPLNEAALNAGWNINPTVEFAGRVILGSAVIVSQDVHLGQENSLGQGTRIEPGAYLGGWVRAGDGVHIGVEATVFHHTAIGRGAVIQTGVVIAPNVRIPDDARVGKGRIIPAPHAIMAISPVGEHHRVVTIHGGPIGPEYSSGCQYSDSWQEFWDRIVWARETTTDSLRHYRELEQTFLAIGVAVQHAYDAAAASGAIDRLYEQAVKVRQKRQRLPASSEPRLF